MIRVVCAIIENGNRFLAAQRGSAQSQGLLWEFPGGKIEPAELASDALTREIDEELGCTVRVDHALTPVVFDYPDKTIELIPFICTIIDGVPAAHEHAAIKWIDADEATGLLWAPADLPIVEEYIQLLNKNSD